MTEQDRYDVSGLTENQYEPGSNEQVLKNRLGIKSSQAMDDTEALALEKLIAAAVGKYDEKHRFTAADIRALHKSWLGAIYDWAGDYRQVNVSKGNFPFAVASRIPALMVELERDVLRRNTPCRFKDRAEVVRALSQTHVELVLIHPFREGNGRIARVLAILMALQAGLPLLDFSSIAGSGKQEYFGAIQAGLDRNYAPMGRLFAEIIERSLAASGEARS